MLGRGHEQQTLARLRTQSHLMQRDALGQLRHGHIRLQNLDDFRHRLKRMHMACAASGGQQTVKTRVRPDVDHQRLQAVAPTCQQIGQRCLIRLPTIALHLLRHLIATTARIHPKARMRARCHHRRCHIRLDQMVNSHALLLQAGAT